MERYLNVKRPNREKILAALALATQAERVWRDAWPDGVPALQSGVREISNTLSTARQLLENMSR